MPVSRSASDFMLRQGMLEDQLPPAPRLCPSDLLIHFEPIEGILAVTELQREAGDPSPDRGAARAWPNQQ